MVVTDPRKVVGCHVLAKARHVLAEGQCRRNYGSLWKQKVLKGTVIAVTNEAKEGGTGRKTTYIVASYDIGGEFKTKKLVMTLVSDNSPPTEPQTAPIINIPPSIEVIESNTTNGIRMPLLSLSMSMVLSPLDSGEYAMLLTMSSMKEVIVVVN
jgi:hypothetical protein